MSLIRSLDLKLKINNSAAVHILPAVHLNNSHARPFLVLEQEVPTKLEDLKVAGHVVDEIMGDAG